MERNMMADSKEEVSEGPTATETTFIDPEIPERVVLDQDQFDKKHGFRRVNLSAPRRVVRNIRAIRTWTGKDWLACLGARIPIIVWLPAYKWRQDILADIIGGLMIAIVNIPQGLAYGLLAGLPPVYGLYSSIIGPLVYVLLGSSKHSSPGTFAIVSLMVGAVVEQTAMTTAMRDAKRLRDGGERLCCNDQLLNASSSPAVEASVAIAIAAQLSLMVGLLQIILGILNAGVLSVWLSDQLVQGLTSGAAFHVLTSQLDDMTGMTGLPKTSEPFGVISFYLCFFHRIGSDIKWTPTITSLICIALLVFSKEILDPVFRPWTRVKVPMELLLVVFSTAITYATQGTWRELDLAVVGEVESGFVHPVVPGHEHLAAVLPDAITIAFISFVIHVAMGKLIAKKLEYEIDANQEWLALGFMHLVSSFFGCIAGGSSLSRTMTQMKLGTKSQLSTLVSISILLFVVLIAASLFQFLPKAVLSCIVIVALKDLFRQVMITKKLFHASIVDFLIWVVTFCSVIIVNVKWGLVIGVAFALLTVVFRSQWAESTCMGCIPGTSDYKGLGHYRTAYEIPGIKVFRFDASLYFANAELFLASMHKATGLDPIAVLNEFSSKANVNKAKAIEKKAMSKERLIKENPCESVLLEVTDSLSHRRLMASSPKKSDVELGETDEKMVQLTHVVLDCSGFSFVDMMGIGALEQAYRDYNMIGISVMYACCKVMVRQAFESTDFYKRVPKKRLFVSVADAVRMAQQEQKRMTHSAPPDKTL